MSEMKSPSASSEKPSWVAAGSLGEPDSPEPFNLGLAMYSVLCLVQTLPSPVIAFSLVSRGIPEVIHFNVEKFPTSLLVIIVSSLRVFLSPKVMEIFYLHGRGFFPYTIFQTMYYFAYFGLWCEVGIKFPVQSFWALCAPDQAESSVETRGTKSTFLSSRNNDPFERKLVF